MCQCNIVVQKDHEISYIATMMTREGFDLPPGVNSTMEADGRELIFQLPHRLMMAIHSLGFSVEEIRPKDSRYYTKFPGEYFFFIIAIGLGFRHYKDHAMAWLHSIQLTFSQVLKNMNHRMQKISYCISSSLIILSRNTRSL